MVHFPLGWLIRKGIEALVGKGSDKLLGGDALDPDYNFVEVEQKEKDPLFPLRVVEVVMDRQAFRGFVAAADRRLDRGLREGQRTSLEVRSGRLKAGEQLALLCNVFHNGVPTGLQWRLQGNGGGQLRVHVEGRGPAMEELVLALKEQGLDSEAGDVAEEGHGRDGRFRRNVSGSEWEAFLPAEWGAVFGQPVAMTVEAGRPGLVGGGEVMDTPLVREILGALPALLGIAEDRLQDYAEDEDVAALACEPRIWLPADVDDPQEWTLVVSRRDWPDFGWHLEFRGTRFRELWAGD